MTRLLLALLLTFAHVSSAAATRTRPVRLPPAPVVEAARVAAEDTLKNGVPAVQIAVSSGGRVVYSGAFGSSDRQSATALTPRSVQQIASISKQFTAAAILRLAERGALTLDDPIEKFVPEFAHGKNITLRQLLSHTSGLRRDWFNGTGVPANPYSSFTRQQVITSLNQYPLTYPPGSKWSYSNAGYVLLAFAIESVSGMSFANFVHTEFVLPLGLLDTGVCGTSGLPLPEGYAFQGTLKRVPAVHPSVFTGAGSLCSTASDLVRWSHLLATGRVMLPESYATMTTAARLENDAPTAYGLGLGLQKLLGRRAVFHDGGLPGFHSFLVYFPDADTAVAVIVNAYPGPTGVIAPSIALKIAAAALPTPAVGASATSEPGEDTEVTPSLFDLRDGAPPFF